MIDLYLFIHLFYKSLFILPFGCNRKLLKITEKKKKTYL